MTGRGIDQVLPHPSDPAIHEDYVKNAKDYVQLAERINGPIPKLVDFSYIWGDALEILETETPDLRIINLETSVTKSNDYWKGKGINYRMNPENVPCLTAAKVDCCYLANNHILDWGYSGLTETLATLNKSGIKTCGAGENKELAINPAIIEGKRKGRTIIFSFGSVSSGVPLDWAALDKRPGVNRVDETVPGTIQEIKENITRVKRPGDTVIASIHWGSNWGYEIPFEQREFAHKLVDEAQVDLIHGHIVKIGTPEELKESVGGDVIVVGVKENEPDISSEIAKIQLVKEVKKNDNVYRIKVDMGEEASPQITDLIRSKGLHVTRVSLTKPTLDEAYLELTGRNLREEEVDKLSMFRQRVTMRRARS